VSFDAITLCVASQQVFIIVVYFVIDSVPKFWLQPGIILYQFNLIMPVLNTFTSFSSC